MSTHDPSCIFCKIALGQIPSRKVYEDEDILTFHDIAPWAPVHFLMIPKVHIPSLAQVGPQHAAMLGRMLSLAPQLALQEGCRPYPEGGYRVLINTGADGRQEVHHLHVHVMGGPRPWLKGFKDGVRDGAASAETPATPAASQVGATPPVADKTTIDVEARNKS